MRVLTALFLALSATSALSQDWATRDLCHAPPLPVTAEDFAPHNISDLESKATAVPNPRGKFWQVTHPNGQISHLWGTMHVSLPSVLNLPNVAKDALENARAVAVEIDFTYTNRDDVISRYDVPGRYSEAGDPFLPPDPLDLSYLGQDALDWMAQRFYVESFEDAYHVYTYAGLAEALVSDPCEDFNAGVIPTQDNFIQTMAHIAGANIISLEGPNDLITNLADDVETAKSIIALYAAYLQPPGDLRNYNAGVQLYLEGRLGLMMTWEAAYLQETYGDKGLEYLATADNYLLALRNRRFVERLIPELETGGVFTAVGAYHLPQDTGMIELLRSEGYDVTRIPLPGEAP